MNAFPGDPYLVHCSENHAIGYCGPMILVAWRRLTTSAGVVHLRDVHQRVAPLHPGGVGLLTIIEANAPAPDATVREELARYMADSAAVLKSSCVVFEGTGFRAAMVRSVVAGLTMLARQPFPHRVFATVDEGIAWWCGSLALTAHLELDPVLLREAVADFRLQYNQARDQAA